MDTTPIRTEDRMLGPIAGLALLLSLALPRTAPGVELTLDEAMATAQAQSRGVVAARSRATAAAERERQARAFRLPSVSLQEVWMRTDSPAEAFAFELNQERFSLAEFATADPNAPAAIDNAMTRLEVALPVYTGGELSSRIRQAALAAEAARGTLEWTELSAALSAGEAYIRLAQVREQVALLERSLETVRAHVALARAYVEQGMLVRSELLRAEVEESRIEDLLSATEGQARIAAANLSFRMGSDEPPDWQLAPLAPPPPLTASLEEWLGAADSRADLEAARILLSAGELEAEVRRAGLLPQVGVVARRDLHDESLFGTRGESTTLMAMARIELFGGGRHRAAVAAARAEAEAGRADVEQFRQGIRLEVQAAHQRAVSARERHRTAVAAQDAAREVERIVEERFEKGVVKTLDLLDAATARREAETRELVARAEAQWASLELAVKAGRAPQETDTGAPIDDATRGQEDD